MTLQQPIKPFKALSVEPHLTSDNNQIRQDSTLKSFDKHSPITVKEQLDDNEDGEEVIFRATPHLREHAGTVQQKSI